MSRFVRLSLGLALLTSAAGAQAPADTALRFNRISGIRELRDGRVLVADVGQSKVWVLSRDLRTGTQVGRTGKGPGAYQSADGLFAFGDTTLIYSFDGANAVQILPDLTIGRADSIAPLSPVPPAFPPEARAIDATGAIYYAGLRPNRAAAGTRDSVPLLRRTITGTRADTVAWLRIPVSGMRRAKNADSLIRSRPDPFEWRDAFTVDASGRVAIIRGDDYRVEYLEAGRVTRGAGEPGARIAVTEADIQRLRDASFTVTTPQGPRTITSEPDHAITPVKPFFPDETRPLVDPNGRLWVERSAAAADTMSHYDVFDRAGKTAFNVTLKDKARVVGFGAGSVYLTKPVGRQVRLSKADLIPSR
jgi:hypothetical protein